ncbi:hypothetical protein QYF36_008803 [Acer negundo]|nr:hypothetical protein QYF36_008803 [Acer negundo]
MRKGKKSYVDSGLGFVQGKRDFVNFSNQSGEALGDEINNGTKKEKFTNKGTIPDAQISAAKSSLADRTWNVASHRQLRVEIDRLYKEISVVSLDIHASSWGVIKGIESCLTA